MLHRRTIHTLLALGGVFACGVCDPPALGAGEFPPLRAVGRLHPLLVHFPIALIVTALLVEGWAMVRRRTISPTGLTCLVFGALGAGAAACAGWFNAQFEFGDEPSGLLEAHRWAAIAGAGLSLIAVIIAPVAARSFDVRFTRAYRLALLVGAITISVAAHLGGSLTYGEDYLVRPARELLGLPNKTGGGASIPTSVPEGELSFETHVRPIMEHSCVSCHRAGKRKGGLSVESLDAIMEGGHDGKAVVPGDPDASNLMIRVLGLSDDDRMPLDRDPLPDVQVEVLRRWIAQGAKP